MKLLFIYALANTRSLAHVMFGNKYSINSITKFC